jgi:hypothetical protein
MKQIELLLILLNKTTDKATRAIILQTFVQTYGPVPDKYTGDIEKALER